MMFIGSAVFLVAMGVLFVLVARGFKAFADDRGWNLTWWTEIMAVLWYAILGLSLYAWGTLIGEGEGDAGFKLFLVGLFVCIVTGVGLVRLLSEVRSFSSRTNSAMHRLNTRARPLVRQTPSSCTDGVSTNNGAGRAKPLSATLRLCDFALIAYVPTSVPRLSRLWTTRVNGVSRNHRRWPWPVARVAAIVFLLCIGCSDAGSSRLTSVGRGASEYTLLRVFEVEGRQGVATDGERYYVSGSKALYVYSRSGELLLENKDPFKGLDKPANHIGDIDVHDGELYAGIEWFVDGQGRDIQIAVYDAETLEYRRSIDWSPESGQVEVSAVAVDPVHEVVWMTDWVDGRYVYRYNLATGAYAGKLQLRPVPRWQQGIAYSRGHLFVTADDGNADLDEADTLWRFDASTDGPSAFVSLEKVFEELSRAGEVEGVTFDHSAGEMAVLSNRGARIVLGMPKEFYPGYDREIHEVYVYHVTVEP